MTPSSTGFVTGLRCFVCNETFPNGNLHTCPKCGVQGILDVQYDYASIGKHLNPQTLRDRQLNHWRFRELLPISPEATLPPLHIGWTPTYDVPRLATIVGISR